MPEATSRRLQAVVLDAAGRFRTRARAPALAMYAADLPALDVKAEVLKGRLKYMARRMEHDPGVREAILEIKAGIEQYDIDSLKGPVALVLKYLRRLELKMDDQFRIEAQEEAPAGSLKRTASC